jgi:hypothetical protein
MNANCNTQSDVSEVTGDRSVDASYDGGNNNSNNSSNEAKRQKFDEEQEYQEYLEEEQVPNDWKTNPATAVSEVAFLILPGKIDLVAVDINIRSFFNLLRHELDMAKVRDFSDKAGFHMENYKKRTLQSWKRHPSIMFQELHDYYKSIDSVNYRANLEKFINDCVAVAMPHGANTDNAELRLGYLLSYRSKDPLKGILAEKDSEYRYDEYERSSSSDASDDEDEEEEEKEEDEDEEEEEEEEEDEKEEKEDQEEEKEGQEEEEEEEEEEDEEEEEEDDSAVPVAEDKITDADVKKFVGLINHVKKIRESYKESN